MALMERGPLYQWKRIKRKDSRGLGFKEASEMLKNYKEFKVWQKVYEPVTFYLPAGRLESLDPKILFTKDLEWKTEF